MSQLFAWGGQSTGVSALASFLPKNTQDWSPLEQTVFKSIKQIKPPRKCVEKCVEKYPLQYSYLANPMDGGAWKAAVHGVAKSQTRLSNFTFTFHFHALEKEMANHSSVLAWKIPGTREPGGLPSLELYRVGQDWSDLAAAAAAAAGSVLQIGKKIRPKLKLRDTLTLRSWGNKKPRTIWKGGQKKKNRLEIKRKIRQLWCLRRQVFQRIENSSMSNVVHKFQSFKVSKVVHKLSLKTKINAKILYKFLNKGLRKSSVLTVDQSNLYHIKILNATYYYIILTLKYPKMPTF